jgi:hypothetical protein
LPSLGSLEHGDAEWMFYAYGEYAWVDPDARQGRDR